MLFDNCETLDELKAAYKAAALEHHPDVGGDAETMKRINAEHDAAHKRLAALQNEAARDPESGVKATTETPGEFREVIDALIRIEGINIELCGRWLWIDGNTYEARAALKAAGCKWSRSKKRWYWRHQEDGARWSRGRQTMDEIRRKYGSERFAGSGAPLAKTA